MTYSHARLIAVVVLAALVVGCAGGRAYRRGDSAARSGDWDSAVTHYRRAVQNSPNRAEYKIALERAMITASLQHLDTARLAEARGLLEDALREYRRASDFDPPNRQLASKVIELERRIRDQIEAQGPRNNIAQLRDQARQAGPAPLFNLNTVVEPLRFNNAQLRDILGALGQATGINITYDSTFADRAYTVNMEGVTLQEALNQILSANQLFYKVVNQRTILISPDTNQKRAQYEELVLKTYYISNADPQELVQMLNGVTRVGGQQLAPVFAANKTTNTLTVRATEAMMSIIDRLVEANDKPRAEIIVDVQILEVSRTRAKQFGLDLGQYQLNAVFSPESDARGSGENSGTLSSRPFNANTVTRGISTSDFYLAVPSAVVRFLESDNETKVVAKPQLRGAEGILLKLNLGEDIPIPTTTFAPIAQGGASVNPLVSFQYRSVGVNVEMTPRVSFEGDIRLELFVESSTLGAGVSIAGQDLPSFGSRKVTTTLRLREGESTLLAGLLREDQRTILRGFPGILRLPVVKQLFSSNDRTVVQTDIVMLLTPRIVRTHELTAQDLAPVYIGTSTNLGLSGPPPAINGGQPAGDLAIAPAPAPAATPAAAVPPPLAPQTQASAAPAQSPSPSVTGSMNPPGPVPSPTSAPSSAGQVLMSLPGNDFRVGGGPYTVPISVTGASQLSSVSLTVTYNPAAVRVRTVQEGTFMRAGGVSAAFTQQSDAAAGRVDLAIVRPGDTTGVAGTGMLAALLFEAVGPGPANFSVTGTASTPTGGTLPLQFPSVPVVTVR